jgi:HEPN domain-containing protein
MSDELSQLLLGLAQEDEFAARSLLPVEGIADSILGFHCQQAVEEALKAALASREIKFPNTHDLDGLVELCRQSGLEVPGDLHGVERLAPYGVQMRYGSARGGRLDRDEALRWAGAAIQWATGLERTRDTSDRWRSRLPDDRADR